MNQFDIEQIAYRSGMFGMDESEAQKTAFWSTFELNLQREIEQEKEDAFRKTGLWNIWED
jgi:hypothetical protein